MRRPLQLRSRPSRAGAASGCSGTGTRVPGAGMLARVAVAALLVAACTPGRTPVKQPQTVVLPAASLPPTERPPAKLGSDRDHDGVRDAQDQCPGVPEDKDGFEDDDGCPDPDNDGDRIPDVDDLCPNEPENYNGIEDEDGCPDHGFVGLP